MTMLRREIVSVPRRTPSETWKAIVELVSIAGSGARHELDAVGNIATTLIAQESTKAAPAIFTGTGPQVRVYTRHDDESLEADMDDERPLVSQLGDDEWAASLPADESDVDWATAALKKVSARVTVREIEA
jgi:hypothetical protein